MSDLDAIRAKLGELTRFHLGLTDPVLEPQSILARAVLALWPEFEAHPAYDSDNWRCARCTAEAAQPDKIVHDAECPFAILSELT